MEIAQSQNTKAEFVDKATSFIGMATYGQIMIGDKAFEFYNSKNPKDYIQIPWNEIDLIIASVYFKGKWIPRFAIQTKQNGIFPFAAWHPKAYVLAGNISTLIILCVHLHFSKLSEEESIIFSIEKTNKRSSGLIQSFFVIYSP